MTKKESIELLRNFQTSLKSYHEAFLHLLPQELGSACEHIDTEQIARLADEFGFDGTIFRNDIPDDNSPLSVNSYKNLKEQITTLPKIIAAIEQYKEPVTIPDSAELLSVSQVAVMLGWGESVVRQRDKEGRLPISIRNGGTIQWNRQELKDWKNAGCPPRLKWEQLKQGKKV